MFPKTFAKDSAIFFFFFFFFFEMKEGYKVSCLKILVLLEGIITEIIRRSAFI